MEYRPPVAPEEIDTFLFRTVSVSRRRERRISITSSSQGRAIKVQSYSSEGAPLGAPVFVFDREAAEVVGALVEAAAAIGVPVPAAGHHVDTTGGALPTSITGRVRGATSPEKNHA